MKLYCTTYVLRSKIIINLVVRGTSFCQGHCAFLFRFDICVANFCRNTNVYLHVLNTHSN